MTIYKINCTKCGTKLVLRRSWQKTCMYCRSCNTEFPFEKL